MFIQALANMIKKITVTCTHLYPVVTVQDLHAVRPSEVYSTVATFDSSQ